MSTFKDFDNKREALIFRESQREAGLAASLFTYGKDRYRVKVMELSSPVNLSRTQSHLSDQAWKVSHDIEDLTEVKRIIESQELIDYNYESIVFVAKYLNKEHWFATPNAVIDFFDGDCAPEKEIAKIKEMVDTALKEYDDDWNDKGEQK